MTPLHWIEFIAAYLAAILFIGVPYAFGLFVLGAGFYGEVVEWLERRRAIKSMQREFAAKQGGG